MLVLKCKLSNHPQESFAEELIHDLCYVYTISYNYVQLHTPSQGLLLAADLQILKCLPSGKTVIGFKLKGKKSIIDKITS